MEIWLGQFFPKAFLEVLPAISLIVIGLLVEKYYVGRIAIFSNAIALSTYYSNFTNLNQTLIWYINILTIFGILAIVSYGFKLKLPKEYYFFAGVFSSIISGAILFGGFLVV